MLFFWLCWGDVEVWVIGLIKDVMVYFVKEVFEFYNLSFLFDIENRFGYVFVCCRWMFSECLYEKLCFKWLNEEV